MLLFTLPLVSGVWCQPSVLCWCGEVASKGNHLKWSVHAHQVSIWFIKWCPHIYIWILGWQHGEDNVYDVSWFSAAPFTTFIVFALSFSADVRT